MNKQRIHRTFLQRVKILVWFLVMLIVIYMGMSWYILQITVTPRRITNTITPDQLGFTETESFIFESLNDETKLHGWLIPAKGDRVIILLHGVHSQAWDGSLVELARAYTDSGIGVLLFDLRGHGWSAGKYVGLGLRERGDVQAAVNQLLMRGYKSGKIGIHGLSYGAAVALLATPEIEEIGAVIADSAFADVRDVIVGEIQREAGVSLRVATMFLPGINFLARLLYSTNISESVPEQVIAGIYPRPVLLIHGTEDNIIPFEQAKRLQAASSSNVELWSLNGSRHTEGIRLEPGYPDWSPLRERYLHRVKMFFIETL